MARANTIQTNFTAGEISPILRGRVDISRYQNGAARLKNFIVKPQGGIFARPGTIFIKEAKDSTKKSRLVEFEFSETVNYLLEFSNGWLRVFKDNVYLGVQVASPYADTDLPNLKFTQSADVLYICHPGFQTRKLIRTSDMSWTFSLFQQTDGPYLSPNTGDTEFAVTGYSDTAHIITSSNSFVIGDVGRQVEYSIAGVPAIANITAYVSAKEVIVSLIANILAPIDPAAVLTRGPGEIVSSIPVFSNNSVGNYIKISPGNWDRIDIFTSESDVHVASGTYADKHLSTVAAGVLDIVVQSARDGTSGNDIFLQAVGDSGGGVHIDVVGDAVVIHYESGVSTVTDIEAAINALTGVNLIIVVETPGTGGNVLTSPGDDFSGIHLTGGTGIVDLVTTVGTVQMVQRTTTGTVTASASTFVSTDVGRHVRLNFSSIQRWGTITAYASVTQVTVTFGDPIPFKDTDATKLVDDGKTSSWRLGAWGATTGYPSVVTFHEERLTFMASPLEPQTFWMSKSGDYENFAPTDLDSKVFDDSAVTYTIASNKLNSIRWAVSGITLVVGTIGGEWQVSGSSSKDAITPTSISVLRQSAHGSNQVPPIQADAAILFIQKAGTKLREQIYDAQYDSLIAKDTTIISEHILREGGRVVAMSHQREPNNIVWLARDDGALIGLTYDRDQEVYAWHYHEIGGALGSGRAQVESVACLPSSSGAYDTLYLIVRRTIGGVEKRYIEYMSFDFDPQTQVDKQGFYFVDCGIRYVGATATSVSGLDHLNGQQVSILANGSVRTSQTVASGAVAVTGGGAQVICAGLMYQSILTTLPPQGGGEAGTSEGKTKRLHRAKIRVYKSMGFKYGKDENNTSQYNFRKTGDAMDSSPDYRSEDIPLTMENPSDLYAQFTVVRDQPYPLNILAVMHEFVTNE